MGVSWSSISEPTRNIWHWNKLCVMLVTHIHKLFLRIEVEKAEPVVGRIFAPFTTKAITYYWSGLWHCLRMLHRAGNRGTQTLIALHIFLVLSKSINVLQNLQCFLKLSLTSRVFQRYRRLLAGPSSDFECHMRFRVTVGCFRAILRESSGSHPRTRTVFSY